MGTSFTVRCWSHQPIDPDSLDHAIEHCLAAIDSALSNWGSDSWITRFNRSPANTSIPIPDHAFPVLTLSLDVAQKTEGALDPTIAPLIDAWGFGSSQSTRHPSPDEISALLSQGGYQKLALDPQRQSLQKSDSDLKINLSATAKGYAVDQIASLLETFGIENFIINFGGEVRASGTRVDGQAWKAAITTPDASSPTSSIGSTTLHNQSLATSGTYLRRNDAGSHIIDPRTGRPVSHPLVSVSVRADSCALADTIATACLVLGREKAAELIATTPGTHAFFVERAPTGELSTYQTDGWISTKEGP